MVLRPVPLAIIFSALLHVSAGTYFYFSQPPGQNVTDGEIILSDLSAVTAKTEAPVMTKEPKPRRNPRKIKKPVPKEIPAAPPEAIIEKRAEPIPVKPSISPAAVAPPAASPPPNRVEPLEAKKPKTSAELLADPRKGKIFSSYFSVVKGKIFRALSKKYEERSTGEGAVSLYFILNSSGRLLKVSVLERDSSPDVALRQLAVECLRSAAPFKGFPRDLESNQIAFQVKIYFGKDT